MSRILKNSAKLNDGNTFYDYPNQGVDIARQEKHDKTCAKNRAKRIKKKRAANKRR